MTRPKIIDTFMINDEMDMLELRLDTMSRAVDWFVAIEADVDHQDHPKPFHLSENLGRFRAWEHQLIVVQASGLPHTPHDQDPWAREWAQREWTWEGLSRVPGLSQSDVVLHGDVDEICRPIAARNVRPRHQEFVQFAQRMYCFAVDWEHPEPWGGTVAVTVGSARLLGNRHVEGDVVFHPGAWQLVRNQRNGLVTPNFEWLPRPKYWRATVLEDAGWHFSWCGGQEAAVRKLGSFCHPEVGDRIAAGLASDRYLAQGYHVDGRKLAPVDVDDSFPPMVRDRRMPAAWYRPR